MDIDWLNQNGFFDIAVKNFVEKTYVNGNLAPASAHTSKMFLFLHSFWRLLFWQMTLPAYYSGKCQLSNFLLAK